MYRPGNRTAWLVIATSILAIGCDDSRRGGPADTGVARADAATADPDAALSGDAALDMDARAPSPDASVDAFVPGDVGTDALFVEDAGVDAFVADDAGTDAGIGDEIEFRENGGLGFGMLVATVPASVGRYDGTMTGAGFVYPVSRLGQTYRFTALPGGYVSPCTSDPHNVTMPGDGNPYTITWLTCRP